VKEGGGEERGGKRPPSGVGMPPRMVNPALDSNPIKRFCGFASEWNSDAQKDSVILPLVAIPSPGFILSP